jgi:hypothetical protein
MQIREHFGHRFAPAELDSLKCSITEMALNRIEGQDELFVGGYVKATNYLAIIWPYADA